MELVDRILVIDDDVELCSLVSEYLEPEGFQVESAPDGNRGLEQALSGDHLLVVLDVMLPGLNGFEVLRRLRDKSRIPVLLLTARGEDVDRIVGLEIGADDYLPKPFNPRELVARIRAILRRTRTSERASSGQPSEPLRVGEVELDPGTRTVLQRGKPVELTLKSVTTITPHNFVLKEPSAGLHIDQTVDHGDTAIVKFTSTQPGTYTFYCDKKLLFFPSHREKGMEGRLEVR